MMMGHYDEYYDRDKEADSYIAKQRAKEKDDASYREFLRNMKRYKEGKK